MSAERPSDVEAAATLDMHHDALLGVGRCGRCAEEVPRSVLLRAAACPCCDSPLACRGARTLVERLDHQGKVWRRVAYALMGAISFGAGLLPLVQAVLQVAVLVILHFLVLRRPIGWLPLRRRVTTSITVKLYGSLISCAALLLNVAVAPLLGLSAAVLGLAGLLLTAGYVEGSLRLIRQRLSWESEGRALQPVEWGLPIGLLAGMLGAAAGVLLLGVAAFHLLLGGDVPIASGVVRWLLGA